MNLTLNTPQKIVLLLGALAIIGVSCFPPWIRVNRTFAEQPAGHAFLLRPPRSPMDNLPSEAPVAYRIDGVWLMKGWLVVAGLALPLAVLLRSRRRLRRPPGATPPRAGTFPTQEEN